MRWLIAWAVIMTLCYSHPVSAQPIITAKVGMSRTHFSKPSGYSIRRSVRAGASVTFSAQSRYTFSLGADYVPKGEHGLGIDYIEFYGLGVFPIISTDGYSYLSAVAGPTVGIKIREDATVKSQMFDLSIAAGVNVAIPISKATALKMELLYTTSIRSVEGNYRTIRVAPWELHRDYNTLKHRVLSFCVGFSFPFPVRVIGMDRSDIRF